jgi:hypothetical protein
MFPKAKDIGAIYLSFKENQQISIGAGAYWVEYGAILCIPGTAIFWNPDGTVGGETLTGGGIVSTAMNGAGLYGSLAQVNGASLASPAPNPTTGAQVGLTGNPCFPLFPMPILAGCDQFVLVAVPAGGHGYWSIPAGEAFFTHFILNSRQ